MWLHPPAFSFRNDLNVYSKPCSPQAITVDKASFCCRGSLWWPTDNLSVVWRLCKLEWYMLTCSLSLCFYVTWKKIFAEQEEDIQVCHGILGKLWNHVSFHHKQGYPSVSHWMANITQSEKLCQVSHQAGISLMVCSNTDKPIHTLHVV